MKPAIFIALFGLVFCLSAPAWALIAGGCGTSCVTGRETMTQATDLTPYLLRQLLLVATFYVSGFFLGRLVQRQTLSASLSRKAICLLTFAISYANSFSVPTYSPTVTAALVAFGGGVILLMLGSLAQPFRKRIPALATVFAAMNRPEDEPYTLPWLATEAVVTTAVILAFLPIMGFVASEQVIDRDILYGLMLIPIFASGVGDALAEIIGKRWGRHQYTTRAIFGNRVYTRSYEGSAMVFLTTIAVSLIIAAGYDFQLPLYFWKAAILLPITLTLAEAKAPHTWDNPLLYLTGYLTIIFCLWV